MRLDGIRVTDLVQVDRKGRVFFAEVRSKTRGELGIKPIDPHVTYRTAAARDVIAVWRRWTPTHPRARSRPRPSPMSSPLFDNVRSLR